MPLQQSCRAAASAAKSPCRSTSGSTGGIRSSEVHLRGKSTADSRGSGTTTPTANRSWQDELRSVPSHQVPSSFFFHVYCKKMDTYAKLSDSAYKPMHDDSHVGTGYDLDQDLSNRNRKVFHNPDTGKAVIAYRGTNPRNIKDLATDALLAAGFKHFSSRFRNAEKAAKAAVSKYGKDNVVLTGHSLGGSQALHVNSRQKLETHAFNPGVSPLEKSPFKAVFDHVMSAVFRKKTRSNAHVYTTGKDPISATAPYIHADSKIHVVKATQKNKHSIKNFLFPPQT